MFTTNKLDKKVFFLNREMMKLLCQRVMIKNIPLLLESELECLLGLERFAVATLFEEVLDELESRFGLPFLAPACGEVDFSLDDLK